MVTSIPKLQNVVILRSFAIMAVVLYHCYCPWLTAWNWADTPARPYYSFIMEVMLVGRMPLFVFVSGYLFSHLYIDRGKYHKFTSFIGNKFKRLLVPMLLFSGLMAVCLQRNYVEMIIGDNCYHLWFLKMLFWCFIVCWVIARFVRVVWIECLVLLLSAALMFMPFPELLGLSYFSKYFFFFIGGYMFYEHRCRMRFIYSKLIGGGIALAYVFLCIVCYVQYRSSTAGTYSDIIHTDRIVALSRYFIRPLSVLLSFILVDWFLVRRTRLITFFDSLNKLSYGIYLFHMLFIQLISKYFLTQAKGVFDSHYIVMPIVLFVTIFSLSAFLTYQLQSTSWGKWLIG